MAQLNAFQIITLNGFYKGLNDDIGWHMVGIEENEFSEESIKADHMLLFGRVTYQLMENYWTSEASFKQFPTVAEGMNRSEKLVFTNTLKMANWSNTKLIHEQPENVITQLKTTSQKDMTILGSGKLVTYLTDKNLVDTYQFMINPVALGHGTPIFEGIQKKLDLKLKESKTFKSGTILLTYETRQ